MKGQDWAIPIFGCHLKQSVEESIMAKAIRIFAGDMADKKISFPKSGEVCGAFTAQGDPCTPASLSRR